MAKSYIMFINCESSPYVLATLSQNKADSTNTVGLFLIYKTKTYALKQVTAATQIKI